MDTTHLLVLGAPRSGTTLLTACVGRHGEVAMLNEDFGGATRKLVGKRVVGNKLCVPNQIEWERRGRAWLRPLQRRGLFQSVPESVYSVQDYLAWDDARVIGIVREGEAVVSSIMRRGQQPFRVAAYRWSRALEVLETVHERRPDRTLLVSYEGFVGAPEATLRRVADHVGLPFDERMLEGYAYTPIYRGSSGIEAQRARRSSPGLDLERRRPDAYARYRRLLDLCTPRHSPHPARDAPPPPSRSDLARPDPVAAP